MTTFPITSLFAAGFALALVALSIPISLRRVEVGVMIGQGEDGVLRNRIRAHGNFIEYVPLGLILLALAEAQGISTAAVLSAGAALALAFYYIWSAERRAWEGDRRRACFALRGDSPSNTGSSVCSGFDRSG